MHTATRTSLLVCSEPCKPFAPHHDFFTEASYRPNYLVYVNTLLFYRVGGETRVSGFMLAGTTTLLLLIGTGPIAFIRTPSLWFCKKRE